MILSLLYILTPEGRIAEALGIHKTLRDATQLAVPVVFGSVGAAFGCGAVFLSNAGMLAVSGYFLRKTKRVKVYYQRLDGVVGRKSD